MEADNELIRYIRQRCKSTEVYKEKHKPNGDDRFKHIYHSGENSAFTEILAVIGEE